MEPGFQFRVLYRDNDLLKVRISAWNGSFGGEGDVYIGTDELGIIGAQLRGFPNSISDIREVVLGDFDSESAGGGVKMRFYCVDRAGHAYVDAKIESDRDSVGRVQSATLSAPIEANAVDSFVDDLRSLDLGTAATASLRATVAVP